MANATVAMLVANLDEFQKRVEFLAMKGAIAIMAEAAITENHAERVIWAKAQIVGGNNLRQQSVSVCTNPTIQAAANEQAVQSNITDNDIEYTVNSMINAWAGVSL